MHAITQALNGIGVQWLSFAGPILIQSSILIVLLFALDIALRRKVRPAVRYALWLMLLVKLVVPPSFASPTSAAWWLRPTHTLSPPPVSRAVVTYNPSAASPVVASTVVAPPPTPSLSVAGWLFVSWTTLSAALFIVVLSRWIQITRRIRNTAKPSAEINEALESARCIACYKSSVRVRLTSNAMSPAVCGLWSPVILLPSALAERMSPAGIRAVLLHELFHLKRRDIWINCLQLMLQIIYWWHPLLWLANARIRRLREEAVDDAVMLALRDEGPNYAPTLLEVARLALARPMVSLGLVGIIESRSALSHRIERLINFTAPRRAGLSAASIIAIVALTAAAVPMAEAPPQPPPTVTVATKPLEIRATSATFDAPTGLATYSGGVVAKSSNVLLTADRVVVERDSGTMAATGHVNLIQETNTAAGDSRRIVMTSPGRRALLEKLDQIRIDSISFQSKPLSEVVVELSDKIQQADPAQQDINFLIQPQPESKAGTIDPLTGQPIAAAPADDAVKIRSITVTIDPPMVNARLIDVLDAIVTAAPQARYSVLDHAIAFSTKGPESSVSATMHIRRFKLDPNVFVKQLQEAGLVDRASMASAGGDFSKVRNLVQNGLISFFAAVGVDLKPETGKNVYWDDRASSLLVRAPAPDLDIIEAAVWELNTPPQPQIHIKAKIIDLPAKIANQVWAQWAPTNTARVEPWSGVLSPSQTKDLLKQLESLGKTVNLVSESSVVTLSGRQAQIELLDTRFIYSGLSNGLPTAQQYPIGTTLDVLPSATSDNQSIQFVLTPSMMEFLGYEDSKGRLSKPDQLDPPLPPRPHFRIRQMHIDRTLPDGSTLMLGHPTVQRMVIQNNDSHTETASEDSQHNLLLLVTPTLIDPAGNPVHPDH